MRKWKIRVLSLFLAALMLTLTVLPASAATASTIKLMKTEGTVSVTSATKRALSTRANMLLYSGYQVQTETDSYAWINLDDSKLGKLDASSSAEVRKSGKNQELLLKSGNLYFNVTTPLESDETLNIRASTMAVGIRGTCGWVKELDEYTTELYLLEGTVQISSADPASGQTKTATVRAGEKAVATVRPLGTEITLDQFEVKDIDGFVMVELKKDPALCADIFEASGLDVLGAVATGNWAGHTYRVYDVSITWEEAKTYCESLGGHLATITSEEENDFIANLLNRADYTKCMYWLGGYRDDEDDESWEWITGERMDFTNWSPGEPTNGNQLCMAIYTDLAHTNLKYRVPVDHGTWFDNPGEGIDDGWPLYQTGFICEWESGLEPQGNTVTSTQDDTVTFNGHRYLRVDQSITWEEAKTYCVNLGGHLATITSQEEQSAINGLLNDSAAKNGYWLGGIRSGDSFAWITGEQMNYTNWDSYQPDNDNGVEDKVMLYSYNGSKHGKWNDLSNEGELDVAVADGTLGFICEWDQ